MVSTEATFFCSTHMYDLIIIGGGPTGINCGLAAAKAGLRYLIIEKGVLVNSIFRFPTNMTFFSTSKLLEIGETPFISHNEKPTRKEALEYYRRLVQSNALSIHFYEMVLNLSKEENGYHIETTKGVYQTFAVVIATGFYDHPNLLNVPGEDLPKVRHYYDEAHHYIDQKVLVIGAANSACDVALETWQKGAKVTMAIRGGQLYEKVKYWILPNIQNRIKEKSIPAYFHTHVVEIKEKSVVLESKEKGIFEIENDYVLAMTGYRPDYEFLHHLGVTTGNDQYKTPTHDKDSLESNLERVYLAGVMNGGLKTNIYFIENTRHHGKLIIDQIVKKLKS